MAPAHQWEFIHRMCLMVIMLHYDLARADVATVLNHIIADILHDPIDKPSMTASKWITEWRDRNYQKKPRMWQLVQNRDDPDASTIQDRANERARAVKLIEQAMRELDITSKSAQKQPTRRVHWRFQICGHEDVAAKINSMWIESYEELIVALQSSLAGQQPVLQDDEGAMFHLFDEACRAARPLWHLLTDAFTPGSVRDRIVLVHPMAASQVPASTLMEGVPAPASFVANFGRDRSKTAVNWTPHMVLTIRLLKDENIQPFSKVINTQILEIFRRIHRQELVGKTVTINAICGKTQSWKRYVGERKMWQKTQRMSKDTRVQEIENVMTQLSIPLTKLQPRDEVMGGDLAQETVDNQKRRQRESATKLAEALNLHFVTEPILVEGAVCYLSYFYDEGVFHSGWVQAERLHVHASSRILGPAVNGNPTSATQLGMVHQYHCGTVDDKIILESTDLVQYTAQTNEVGGFVHDVIAHDGHSFVARDVMLCAGPPFCGHCSEKSTPSSKSPVIRTIALQSDNDLPMVHANDCFRSQFNLEGEVNEFYGRKLTSVPSYKPPVDAFPTYSQTTVLLVGANSVAETRDVYMCNPNVCINCTQQTSAEQKIEKTCMPGSEYYEMRRAEAIRSGGRTGAVLQMADADGDVGIDPQLWYQGVTTQAPSLASTQQTFLPYNLYPIIETDPCSYDCIMELATVAASKEPASFITMPRELRDMIYDLSIPPATSDPLVIVAVSYDDSIADSQFRIPTRYRTEYAVPIPSDRKCLISLLRSCRIINQEVTVRVYAKKKLMSSYSRSIQLQNSKSQQFHITIQIEYSSPLLPCLPPSALANSSSSRRLQLASSYISR
ncbi:hypothetical protein EJ03DRAFT_338847 [Teratosphaeria nubilosa]|uniref:Uncharacterized protein n=1 Tax=Teratosphaeria nubilosa TaxID=161662 RepID=A0A6G1KYP2_9PEZI|nr:hypothetical protein EJ03DRAFT_338847 [Teratosphaeria nubilosa]